MRQLIFTLFIAIHAFVSVWGQSEPELVVPQIDGRYISRLAILNSKQKLLFSVGSDKNVKVWDLSDKTLLKSLTFSNHLFPIDVKVHQARKKIVVLGKRQLAWVDAERFAITHSQTMPAAEVQRQYDFSALAFSYDGNTLYVAGNNGKEFSLWSIPVGGTTFTRLLSHPLEAINWNYDFDEMAVTADGRFVVLLFNKQRAYLAELSSKKVTTLSTGQTTAFSWIGNEFFLISSAAVSSNTSQLLRINNINSRPSLSLKLNFLATGIEYISRGDRFLVYGEDKFSFFDKATNSIPETKSWPVAGVVCARPLADGNSIVLAGVQFGAPYLLLFDLSTNQILELGFSGLSVGQLASSADKAVFVARDFSGVLKMFSFGRNGLTLRQLPYTPKTDKIAVSSNGARAACITIDDRAMLFDARTGQVDSLSRPKLMNDRSKVLNSRDGRYTILLGSESADVYDHHKGTLQKVGSTVFKMGDMSFYNHLNMRDGAISPDGKKLVASVSSKDKSVRCWDITTGKELWSIDGLFLMNYQFGNDGKTLVATQGLGQLVNAIWIDTDKGEVTKSIRLDFPPGNYDTHVGKASISSNLKVLLYKRVVDRVQDVALYDLETGKIIGIFKSESSIYDYEMLPGSRYALINYLELDKNHSYVNPLVIYDFEKAAILARVYLSNYGNDWLVLSAAGYYDGSTGAIRRLLFRKNGQIFPVESFAGDFYRPGLLTALLQGVEPTPVNWDDINDPPTVRIFPPIVQRNLVVDDDAVVPTFDLQDRKVIIKVQGVGGKEKISEIRLFHNGKRVGQGARNLVIDHDEQLPSDKIEQFAVELSDGPNDFMAVAVNTQNVQSAPAFIRVNLIPQINPSPYESKPALHLLIVGINEYKNPRYRLNYAVDDAKAFGLRLSQNAEGLFRSINKKELVDNQATKENIIAALNDIKRISRPEDVLVFFYAGHGVLGGDNLYYLIPFDVVQMYGDPEQLSSKAIGAELLKQMSSNIAARKQLFLLDACQSAGAFSLANNRAAVEEKTLAELARATGTYWLAASGSEQFAAEFDQLGHGVFTYALLEALNGSADNGDKKISVKELDMYLQTVVPDLSQKYKGTPQYPASFSFGNDFPIALIKNKQK